jgi:hypothetical protein
MKCSGGGEMEAIEHRKLDRKRWSDERLTAGLAGAAGEERGALVELLLDLAEFDRRYP